MPRIAVALAAALSVGCTSIPLEIEKTNAEKPMILKGKRYRSGSPRRLIFLSPNEAQCPTQCSATVQAEAYNKAVTRIEQRLQERGYSLISGAIVSRIEDKLKDSLEREEWDRTEKALLLGAQTGADAIFEVRAIYVDQSKQSYLKESHEDSFHLRPVRSVQKTVNDWPREAPSGWWLFLPVYGWFHYAAAYDPPSGYEVPIWEATVTARMIDLDGNVLWSGSKTVRSTDIIPDDWRIRLDGNYPWSKIRASMGKRDQNFDYLEYYADRELQREQLYMIIDSLIEQLQRPI